MSQRDGESLLRYLAEVLHQRSIAIQHLIISTYEQHLDGTEDSGELFSIKILKQKSTH